MSKKKPEKKKSPYPENGKVKIRHSYYTFAREFPSKILPLEGKRRKNRKKRILQNVISCFIFVFLLLLSYFTVNLFVDISYTDADKLSSYTQQTAPAPDEGEPLPFGGESVKALYMPEEKLGDSGYIKELIRQIRRKNANSVIIDFKTAEGRLSYTSLNEYAISARCALYDNNTVRQALSLFRGEGIKVIAGIYCFADETVASACPELAVKYMDSDVNWTSAKTENGGKERLNPVSKQARDYITDVITEVLSFSPDGILLYEASFPSGEFISSATYPGEKKSTDRNEILRSFISQIKKSLPAECILLMDHSARDVLDTNTELYSGSMLGCAADGFAVDTLERNEGITVDKKTDFVSVFSFFASLKKSIGDKKAVYTVDISEYSSAYLRKMQKAGYTDFIIYSPEGIYN